ncbi:MAG TPA: KTSC domain-containing protein [Candidatus Sulfotelmatobacter sp.]|nr:KTSC domain-containing protein [Candidatus Sulfotelmatobacter sp.]
MSWSKWIDTPESSNISRFRHDDTNQVLEVEFKTGGVYQYFDVPEIIFEQMQSASSKGQFLAQSVKGHYRYARM